MHSTVREVSYVAPHPYKENLMTDSVRRINLGAIECAPRPQLPDGFRRHSVRVGATLGAERSGLSVYELPAGQAVSPYHYEEPEEEWLLSSLAPRRCGTPMARRSSSRGTLSSSLPGPRVRTS